MEDESCNLLILWCQREDSNLRPADYESLDIHNLVQTRDRSLDRNPLDEIAVHLFGASIVDARGARVRVT